MAGGKGRAYLVTVQVEYDFSREEEEELEEYAKSQSISEGEAFEAVFEEDFRRFAHSAQSPFKFKKLITKEGYDRHTGRTQ